MPRCERGGRGSTPRVGTKNCSEGPAAVTVRIAYEAAAGTDVEAKRGTCQRYLCAFICMRFCPRSPMAEAVHLKRTNVQVRVLPGAPYLFDM